VVFKRLMMRKCKFNSEQFCKKLPEYKKAVNGRSRYEHLKYLKRFGINPKSRSAKLFSKSKKNLPIINSENEENNSSSQAKRKNVSFSIPLSQSIPNKELESFESTNKTTLTPSCVKTSRKSSVATASVDYTLPLQPTAGPAAAASSSRLTERKDVVLVPSTLNYFPQIDLKKSII